jgi:hypothetical protein
LRLLGSQAVTFRVRRLSVFVGELRFALFSFELSDGRTETPGRRPYPCDHVAALFLWQPHNLLERRTVLSRSWPMNPHKATITASQIRLGISFELSPQFLL